LQKAVDTGETALEYCLKHGHIDAVKALMLHGAKSKTKIGVWFACPVL
jgi:ankyrin repeat protein